MGAASLFLLGSFGVPCATNQQMADLLDFPWLRQSAREHYTGDHSLFCALLLCMEDCLGTLAFTTQLSSAC